MFVLALPLSAGAEAITLLAFVGGLSAATAMVIVEFRGAGDHGLQRPGAAAAAAPAASTSPSGQQQDMAWLLLAIRRVAIFAVILLGYLFYRLLGQTARPCLHRPRLVRRHRPVRAGLLRRPGLAQCHRARRHRRHRHRLRGVGLHAAAAVDHRGRLAAALHPDGRARSASRFLSPQALFYLQLDPLTHGVLWSMAANMLTFVTVSLLKAPEPIERLQAQVFVLDDLPRPPMSPAFRLWRTSSHGRRPAAHGRPLSRRRARGAVVRRVCGEPQRADLRPTPRPTSTCCASPSICWPAPSARPRRGSCCRCCCAGAMPAARSALRLLDDASEALQYNRDLLQSALDQVRHGLERVRQGHAADLLEPAVPRAARTCRPSSAGSARRSTASCARAPSAATSAPATSTSSSPTG